MRLSEAIRAGCALGQQAFWPFDSDAGYGLCALAGAAVAAGLHGCQWSSRKFKDAFPVLTVDVSLPTSAVVMDGHLDAPVSTSLFDTIWWINDSCHWSREAIAEWVETIENKLEAEAVKRQDVPVGGPPAAQTSEVHDEHRSVAEAGVEAGCQR